MDSIYDKTSSESNINTDTDKSTKSSVASPVKVKPCCVCKDEKAFRDNCMLFSSSTEAQKDCAESIENYRKCMASYGFKLP
ncbi:Cytochrome c oxidase copper chaperone [Golovinomyces cichoracearum]|uniref:Cytochrome c oxidase copper chaperone n=1 Tax=Golovinomyces cichoracearum TaxID=62708 RepID=A0A420HDT7_9PEZI|nr:Cytochrome c oxidase copper chaperone [Golovinomyces cichoracearum]